MSLPEAALPAPSAPHAGAPERLEGAAAFTRALIHDFSGYLISLGLLNLGNLLLLPLITAYLTPAEVGLYSLVETAQLLGGTFSLLGMKFAYLYYYAQSDATRRSRLLGNALILVAIAGLGTGLLMTGLFTSSTAMEYFDAASLPMAWLLAPLMLEAGVFTVLLTELRASRHVGLSGIITVSHLVLWLLLSVWLVAIGGHGLPGLIGAQVIALTLSCIIALILVGGRIGFSPDRHECLRLLRYGFPMMLGLVLRYSLDTLCRFALAALVSIEAAGQFMVISRVTTLFEAVFALPFLTAWGGLVHHALRRPEAARIVGQVSSMVIAASVLLALIMLAGQPLLMTLLAHDAMPQTAGAFALLLLMRVVLTAKSPLTAGILCSGRTGWSISNNLFTLAVFLVAAYPASRIAGLTGMALAMLLAHLAATVTLGLAAWPDCPQRISLPAAMLGLLLGFAVAATAITGPLPLWLDGITIVVALGLILPLARHFHVTD